VSVTAADVGLIVAALDLNLVRLLRGAMAPNPHGKPVAFIGPAPTSARLLTRPRIEPTPRFEPRPVVHPTPRFEPRPVIHPRPRVEPTPAICEPPHDPEMPVRSKSPIEPPWRVLPWETPPQPTPKVKLAIYRPDVVSKGSLIDFFI
jgi:hypothetical protein